MRGYPLWLSTAISTVLQEIAHSLIHSLAMPHQQFPLRAGRPGPISQMRRGPSRGETELLVFLDGRAAGGKLTHLWRDFGQFWGYMAALCPAAAFHVKQALSRLLPPLTSPPSNILGYSHLRPFRPRCPPIFPQSYPQQYPPANWLSEPVVMAAKFALGRYRFNPLRQTRNRRYRVLEITGDSSMTSTLRRHAVSRRYLLTVLPVSTLAMPYKPDEQLPSRYRRPRLRVQPPRAGEPASGVWSPPCGSAVHVLGSKIRTRFSPGRRPGAGVRGPVSVVRRPASGVRGQVSGGRHPASGGQRPWSGIRLWVSVSEL